TVIATGFREVDSARRQKENHIYVPGHEDAQAFPELPAPTATPEIDAMMIDDMPDHVMADQNMNHRPFIPDAPDGLAVSGDRTADVIPLDTMRGAMASNMSNNFERDDLDVPAFLRKRNDVM